MLDAPEGLRTGRGLVTLSAPLKDLCLFVVLGVLQKLNLRSDRFTRLELGSVNSLLDCIGTWKYRLYLFQDHNILFIGTMLHVLLVNVIKRY